MGSPKYEDKNLRVYDRAQEHITKMAKALKYARLSSLSSEELFKALTIPTYFGERDTATSKLPFLLRMENIEGRIEAIFQDIFGLGFARIIPTYGSRGNLAEIRFDKKYIDPFNREEANRAMHGEFDMRISDEDLEFHGLFIKSDQQDIRKCRMKKYDASNPKERGAVELIYKENIAKIMEKT